MKVPPTVYPAVIVVAISGLATAWIAQHHRAGSHTAEAAAGPPDLAADDEPVLRRVAIKQEVAAALLRGEIDLPEAAARFRDINAGNPAAFTLLRELYPKAGEDELEFRQVLHFVRWVGPPLAGMLPVRLPRLEAEFFARFPAGDPFPKFFRNYQMVPGSAARDGERTRQPPDERQFTVFD